MKKWEGKDEEKESESFMSGGGKRGKSGRESRRLTGFGEILAERGR